MATTKTRRHAEAGRRTAKAQRRVQQQSEKAAKASRTNTGKGGVAVLYAREGADVAIAYLEEDEDAEETRHAVEAEGAHAILLPGDVGDPEFCRYAVQQTIDELGGLDILVNNAAFQESADSLEEPATSSGTGRFAPTFTDTSTWLAPRCRTSSRVASSSIAGR